ncbi:MAG: hypothetical protein HY925_15865, partial [Elusimicrobia bacterium]|nr:hypothetical protein [Elusimicrobiota bacterium]
MALGVARRAVSALLCAAVVLTSPGLGVYEALAQQITQVPQGVTVQGLGTAGAAGMAGSSAIPGSTLLPQQKLQTAAGQAPLVLPVTQGLTPATLRNLSKPVTKEGRPVSAVAGAGSAKTEKSAPMGRFSTAVVERLADAERPSSGLFQMVGASARNAATASSDSPLKPSAKTLESEGGSRSWAQKMFDFAKDGAPAAEPEEPTQGKLGDAKPSELSPAPVAGDSTEAKAETPAPAPAPAAKAAPSRTGKLLKILAATATIALGTFGFLKLSDVPTIHHPLLTGLGAAGMWIGNLLAIAYPIPEIFATFRHGNAKSTPVSAAVAGTAAPLAQGVISAPLKGQPVWGLQNLFGAATTIAPLVFGRYLNGPVSVKTAAWRTALTCAIAAGVSLAIYAGAVHFVPGFVLAAVGPAGKSALLLALQALAFAGFIYLFIPTIKDVLQGRTPRAFTPGFSLAFAIASVGFVAWMMHDALAAAPNSMDRMWSLIYAAQNVVLFAISFASYVYSRTKEDVGSRVAKAVMPASIPGGIYGVMLGSVAGLVLAPINPLFALAMPLFGWAIGGAFKGGRLGPDGDSAKNGVFYGLAAATMLAAGLTSFGIPLYYLTVLPFLGAMLGWRATWSRNAPVVDPSDLAPFKTAPAEEAPAAEAVKVEPVVESVPAPRLEPAAPAAAPALKGSPEPSVPGATPRSFKKLPSDARETTTGDLMKESAAAQARARAMYPDARLIKLAINLDDGRAHWIFVFRSDKKKKDITVWRKRIGVARADSKPMPTLWRTRLAKVGSLEDAYTRLKQEKHWFAPVRVEIRPTWKGDPNFLFLDSRGRMARVSAVSSPIPDPQPPDPGGQPSGPPTGDPQANLPQPPAPETGSGGSAGSTGSENPSPETPKSVPLDYKAVHESFFGFRKVVGLRHENGLKPLPLNADTQAIMEQISKQFNIPMPKLRDIAQKYQLSTAAPREKWLAIYDRLQRYNASEFANLDSRKYHGFRELANVRYPDGWRGWALRASEVHKHLAGFFVRMWYHLFDSFVFGYFRRAISFRFFHSTEDFISIPKPKTPNGKPEASDPTKYLEAALSAESFKAPGSQSALLAAPWARAIKLYAVECFVMPLGQFIVRRATLAIMSSIAMGVLAAFAPMLPLSLSLTAVPYLGHGILALADGLPQVIASVPFVGAFFAPVVDKAIHALVGDLVLGPMLNTLILTTMLTYPQALKRRLMDSREGGVRGPPVLSGEFLKAVALTFVSWDFWRDNGKSYFGMITVGAEIEGVMQYAKGADAFVDRAWHPVTGGHFTAFHTIGAAVERPANHPDEHERSPIPFGGAITWGSTLIYKLQDAVGFNLSDATFRVVSTALALVHSTDLTRALANLPAGAGTAQALVHTVEQRAEGRQEWEAELRDAKLRLANLEAQLTGKTTRLEELRAQSKPVTAAEQAEYDRLTRELDGKRLENYAQSKLSQIHDLKNPKDVADARLLQLKQLQDIHDAIIHPDDPKAGYAESLAAQAATLRGLEQKINRVREGVNQVASDQALGSAAQADPKTVERIETLVKAIEDLRAQSQGEMASEQAQAKLLSALNRLRNAALRERRDGKTMMEFYKNNAKLATVMDLALGINEATAGIEQLDIGIGMADAKLRKIEDARRRAADGQAAADRNKGNMDQWRRDAQADIDDDKTQKDDMVKFEGQTAQAVQRITAFRDDIGALIARIDAEDAGQSANALAEYRRRQALLPTLVEWKTNGKPGDPDYRNLKDVRDTLQKIKDYDEKIAKGLIDVENVPDIARASLIIAVPGVPDYTIVNTNPSSVMPLLTERKAYWQEKLNEYTRKRDDAAHRLDPNYSGTEVDEDFGDVNPMSLPRRLSQAQDKLTRAQADAATFSGQIDRLAAEIAANGGGSLPPLSGLSLEQMKEVIETYADKLSAVQTPAGNEDAAHTVTMDVLSIGKLLPYLGYTTIKWAKADAEVSGINDVMNGQLPAIKAGLDGIVATIQGIVDDTNVDIAFVARQQQGWIPSQADANAVMTRKVALLRNAQTTVQGANGFVGNQLLRLVEDSIASVQPNGDKYAKLFSSQIKLYEAVQKAQGESLPWGLASKGAAKGDVSGGLAGNQEKRDRYRKFMEGYDEGGVHHKGIREYQLEVQQRKDPNFSGTEFRNGETQPFSLPRKITQYTAERAERARQFNQQAGEVNQILAQIDQMTANRFTLGTRFSLPTNLDGNNPASVAAVQSIVDRRVLQDLGDVLTAIGDEYKNRGPEPSIDSGEGIPTGTQPSPTLPPDRQIALLALQAARRLVPTSLDAPQSAPAAYAVARVLYSDAVVVASKDALDNQITAAEPFLAQGARALQNALAALDADDAYVRSNGTNESGQAVIDRSIRVYGELNSFLSAGVSFFGLKGQWDQDSLNRLDRIQTYYDSLSDINRNGVTASDSETEAVRKIRDALQKTRDELQTKLNKLKGWMNQLNRPEESALKRVAEDLRKIQLETRAVLERNLEYHEMEEQHRRSADTLQWTLHQLEKAQHDLEVELRSVGDTGRLPAPLLGRLDKLSGRGGAWMMQDTGNATQTLVIPKSNFSYFVDQLFSTFKPESSGQNLAGLKREILANPQNLTQLIPDSRVVDFGDNADGFYLVYQSQFSVPHGLETSSLVTLGNIGKLAGNNIRVTGYTFASPSNPENAPWGDKGVVLQVESIQGKNWVNYFEVDLHRFIQDYPEDTSVADQAKQSRLRVFNDHAELLFGGKLYIALTGFGDFALDDTWNKPYYFGGSGKVSWKFSEAISLNAEEQRVYAKDPRWFSETFNLDFTHWDPDLNRDLVIRAKGENKDYRRDQIGPSIDVGKLMGSEDAFTVDLFVARQTGTDDFDQTSGGVAVVKGFTIKDAEGKPWAVINNRATAEMGQVYNSYSDRVSVTLPDGGVVVSAEGRLVGTEKTYLLEASKKTSDHSSMAVSYGSRYIGSPNRLTISMNTAFTLGELWRAVAKNAADDATGGEVLRNYNAQMNDFYERAPDDRMVQEMKNALVKDVGMKLLQQDIGTLTRDIQELRRKGAFMDNSRVRGMVGFVTNPISTHIGDRLVGGGFTAGTQTELVLTRPQKELIDSKTPELVEASLRLQERALERIQSVQAAIAEVAQAQWHLKLARYAALNGQSDSIRAESEAKVQEATLELDQALIRFNLMTGRSPSEAFPFGDLSARDLEALSAELEKLVASPNRVTDILHSLDEEEVVASLGEEPFTVMKWIPWVDQIGASFGIQLQDMLANQALVIGARVRLPIYDPSSKERDHAYVFESQAAAQRIAERYQAYALKAEKERQLAAAASTDGEIAQAQVRPAANDLRDAIKGYRNGLVSQERLRASFERWDQYQRGALRGRSAGALAEAWSVMDRAFSRPAPKSGEDMRLTSFAQAFELASQNSRDLAEVGFREQAAAAMTAANNHRIEKAKLDLNFGTGLTADGVGWIPSIGMTGFGITPVLTFELKPEELRELQVAQGKAEGEMYDALATQLEINLAVQFYENAATAKATQAAYWKYQNELIPSLERELARAQAAAAPGSDAAQQARRALDSAKERRDQVWLAHRNAVSTINYLLGRAPDAPLDVDISPEQALAELKAMIAEKNPVETGRKILDARISTARAMETIADKDLKSEELRLEPVSLIVRSLGRLLNTLSDEGIGNPDLVAAT